MLSPAVYADAYGLEAVEVLVARQTHPYTGSLAAHKRTRVNYLLYWTVVEWAVEQGAHTFDMGRSLRGSGNEAFKRRWGGEEEPLFYLYRFRHPGGVPPDLTSPTLRRLTATWRHLPPAVAARLGPRLIRYVP